jgi:hypothetical protein
MQAHEDMKAAVAQPVERILGKDEVMGPIPISSFSSDERGSPRGDPAVPVKFYLLNHPPDFTQGD